MTNSTAVNSTFSVSTNPSIKQTQSEHVGKAIKKLSAGHSDALMHACLVLRTKLTQVNDDLVTLQNVCSQLQQGTSSR